MDDGAYNVVAAVLAVALVGAAGRWEARRAAEKRAHPERFTGPAITGEGWVAKEAPADRARRLLVSWWRARRGRR